MWPSRALRDGLKHKPIVGHRGRAVAGRQSSRARAGLSFSLSPITTFRDVAGRDVRRRRFFRRRRRRFFRRGLAILVAPALGRRERLELVDAAGLGHSGAELRGRAAVARIRRLGRGGAVG